MAWGPWQHQVCRDTDCLCCRSYGPIRIFFQASCSRRSEGLFGQSYSIALTLQALRGLPCLGSFSVDRQVRHLKGHPGWGSYSVVQCIRRLMGQPLYCSAADAGVLGKRGYGDGPTPMCDLLPWLPGFPPQAFPTTISSLTSPQSVSAVNSRPCPGIAPQSLDSSSQPLSHLGYVWL